MSASISIRLRSICRLHSKLPVGALFGRNSGRFNSSASAGNAQTNADSGVPPPDSEGNITQENAAIKKLEEDNKKIIEQIKTIDDKYKRALAENENVRFRMRKQVEEAKQFGIQNFCKDLTEVADVLSTAVESVPKDALNEGNPHLKQLFEGLKMTEAQLTSVFRRHGLTEINPIGSKFDPNQHQAMFEIEDVSKEPGSIGVVTKLGYKLKERTIRPAMVGVIKRPE